MPKWIHDRVEHIKAKNPGMPESEAWAIATQQAHAVHKSPKGYGTPHGRHVAKEKYDTPKDDKKTANPGKLKASSADIVPGGKADNAKPSDFDPKQLEMGKKVEREHTNNPELATQIAEDHLVEFKDYYSRLKKMEDQAKKDEGKSKEKDSSIEEGYDTSSQQWHDGGKMKSSSADITRPVKALAEEIIPLYNQMRHVPTDARTLLGGINTPSLEAGQLTAALRRRSQSRLPAPTSIPESVIGRTIAGDLESTQRALEAQLLDMPASEWIALMKSKPLKAGMNPRRAMELAEVSRRGNSVGDFLKTVEASVNLAAFFDELTKIGVAGDSPYLLDQITKPKIRATKAESPNPKLRAKVAYIPVGPAPMLRNSHQNDPAKRLAMSQRVGTPGDPNGPKFKPLNMLKPPGAAQTSMAPVTTPSPTPKFAHVKRAFQTSDFAGGQLYPSPRANALPISGRAQSPIYLPGQMEKTEGDGGKEKKSNVQSPAAQLSGSRKQTSMTAPGPSIAQVSKPVGFGTPMPGAVKKPAQLTLPKM